MKSRKSRESRTQREDSLKFQQLRALGLVSEKDYKEHKQRESRVSSQVEEYDEDETSDVDENELDVQSVVVEEKEEKKQAEPVLQSVAVMPMPPQRRGSMMGALAANAWQSVVNLFEEKPYEPSAELIAFLAVFDLTVEDFENTPMAELEQLLNQGWYGRILNAYASNHLLFKLLTFWFLDEKAIKLKKDIDKDGAGIPDKYSGFSGRAFLSKALKQMQAGIIQHGSIEMSAIKIDNAIEKSREEKSEEKSPSEFSLIQSSDQITPASATIVKTTPALKIPSESYCASRIWPKNKILLFEQKSVLAKIYSIESALNALRLFNKVWAVLIFSLLSNDIYYYYRYPEKRYDNTLSQILLTRSEHSKMLSRSLTSPAIWPELIVTPLVLMLISALYKRSHPSRAIPLAEINAIFTYWSNYESTLKQDIFYSFIRLFLPGFINKRLGINPFPNSEYDFDNVIKTILYDGRVAAAERIRLLNATKKLLHRSTKLLRLELLTVMEFFAENIHPRDIERLYQYGYEKDIIKSLLNVQANALKELKNQAQWKNGLLAALYAHFLLWNIGQPESKILQPFFWAFQTFRWYALVNFIITLSQGIKDYVEFIQAKWACEAEGKLWLYMDLVVDYRCTVCGYLPIYYWDMFTKEDCIRGWFKNSRRTVDELIDFFENPVSTIDWSDIKVFVFDQQFLNGHELKRFLQVLKKHMPYLQELHLNMTRPDYETCFLPQLDASCESLNKIGLEGVADFVKSVPVEILDLRGQFIQGEDLEPLSRVLVYTRLYTLDLSSYYFQPPKLAYEYGPFYNQIGGLGAEVLSVGLPRSLLQYLNLNLNFIDNIGAKAIGQILNSTNLRYLNLGSNHDIDDVGAQEMAQGLPGSYLEDLDLNYNAIGNIGAQFLGQKLLGSCLKRLILNYNNIGDAGAQGIAQGLSGSVLEILDLEYNYIADVGAQSIGQNLPGSNLTWLSLGHNFIGDVGVQGIGKSLSKANLKSLALYNNNIGDLGAQGIGQGLPRSNLRELHLYNNVINDVGAQGIGQGLSGSNLTILSIFSNNIGAVGAQGIGQGLPGSCLKILDLGKNNIGDTGAQFMGQGLPGSNLTILNLGTNNIGDIGACGIGQGLLGSCLEILGLHDNNIGDVGAQGIGQGLPGSNLRELYLYDNVISDVGAQGIGQGLSNSSLEVLGLSHNNIGNVGAQSIGQNLPDSYLLRLDLSDNNISDIGAQGIGQGLPGSKLEILGLYDNNVGDIGAQGIGQGLPGSNLYLLDLHHNNIDNAGAQGIAQGLPGSGLEYLILHHNNIGSIGAKNIGQNLLNTNLKWLDLGNNKIIDIGTQGLSQGLPGANLKFLCLEHNGLNDTGARAISQGLPSSNLEYLCLQGNNIGDTGVQAIADAIVPISIVSQQLLWIDQLNSDMKRIMGYTQLNIKLENLLLMNNNITSAGARALCNALPYSGMPFGSINFTGNPVSDTDPELIETCGIVSAASRAELPLPFRLLGYVYRSIKEIIFQKNNYPVFVFDQSSNNFANTPSFSNKMSDLSYYHIENKLNERINPALPYPSSQNNTSIIPAFATLLLLGMMLLYLYKTFFTFESKHRKTTIHHNSNTFWLSSKKEKSNTENSIPYYRKIPS